MRQIDLLKQKSERLVAKIEKNKARLKISEDRLDDVTISLIRKEIDYDKYRIHDIERQLDLYKKILDSEPVYETAAIDLYALTKSNPNSNKNSFAYYGACIHGEKTFVGIFGYQNQPGLVSNNISGEVFEDYRNQGYGYQATVALLEYLPRFGIDIATFGYDNNNIPSKKAVDKIKEVYPVNKEKVYTYTTQCEFDITKKLSKGSSK